MLLTTDRRDRLDKMIDGDGRRQRVHRGRRPVGLPARRSTLTGFGLAVEIGDWDRFTGDASAPTSGLVPTEHSSGGSRSQGVDHQDRQQPRPPAAGRGGLAPPPAYRPVADHARPLGAAAAAARARGHAGNQRLHDRWKQFTRRKRPVVANVAIARELAGWCWSLAILPTNQPPPAGRRRWPGGSARSNPRPHYEQPAQRPRSIARQARTLRRTARPAVTNPRISV